jgi:ubiquinone/menaquinone biosynthesis C-methylase UbiE
VIRFGWSIFFVLAACGRSGTPAKQDGRYQGRTIAPACSHLGADWLERADREAREQPERALDLLQIDRGMTVADVGAGTGYFTVRLARRVGSRGRVLATDIQPEMLRRIDARLGAEGIKNVQLIRATASSAELPARCCDLVLLVDVYHELADPPGVMAGIRRALKETGRLALIEYRGEDPSVPIRPEHKMTLAQIKAELEPLGFAFVSSLEELRDQRIVIFTRDDVIPAAPPR